IVQPRLSDPLDAEGGFVWRGEEVSFTGRVDALQALLRDASSKTRLALSTRRGKAGFEGQIKLTSGLGANGVMSGETASLRALANWLGNPLPPGGGLEAAAISGRLGFKNGTVSFTKARLGLDGMNGKGQASIRFKGARPYIKASLALDKLDLNPYLRGASAASAAPPARTASTPQQTKAPAAPAPKPKAKQSLTDFIDQLNTADEGKEKLQPQVRAWSQRAMNLTGLRGADADVNITAGALYYQNIKMGKSTLSAALKNGLLSADLTRMALYSGTGTGRVTVNAARAVPGIAAIFNLQDISALPLLKDAVDFKWISGRANMAISLSGTGRSQSELVRSMQGQARLVFANGAIEGINIPAMVRGLKRGELGGWKLKEREKTDFSQLSGTFLVQNGIATNKDLSLISPLIRMTGEGTVDLGRERIDYAALPRLVANLQGQGATGDDKGIAVPVRIKGSWDNPKIVPDLDRLLRDPELVEQNAKKIGKVLKKLKKKEDVNKLLQGLLGGNQGAADGTQPQGEKVRPEDVLKNLLR
ncbi:MAG: AsmA-like C-terminal region-containing protein, partial [Methyloligellaceae bacterium]